VAVGPEEVTSGDERWSEKKSRLVSTTFHYLLNYPSLRSPRQQVLIVRERTSNLQRQGDQRSRGETCAAD
jgi:hypothetical protein